MKNYKLNADEVVLFKENCQIEDIIIENKSYQKGGVLMLTNQNIVFTFCENEQRMSVVWPVSDVKIYKEQPQINIVKTHAEQVEIYFTYDEIHLKFENKKVAKQFVTKACQLIIGKTSAEQFLSKVKTGLTTVKKTIEIVDETLEIDTVEMVQSAMANSARGSTKGEKVLGAISVVAKSIFANNKKQGGNLPPATTQGTQSLTDGQTSGSDSTNSDQE